MAKRVYKRDAAGRFAGGSGGGGGGGSRGGKTRRPAMSSTRKKLRKVGRSIKKAAKNPENVEMAINMAILGVAGAGVIRQGAALNASQNRARRMAQDRVSRTSGIGSGSSTLRMARTRRGVHQL